MDRAEILGFLNKNQVCWVGTIDGGKPRVRGMMMYRADDKGILFHSAKPKDVVKQLRVNPNIELCFEDIDMEDPSKTVQIRVMGTAEFVDDQSLKEEIVAARPFLRPMVDEGGYEVMEVFRVKDCKANVWIFAENLAAKAWIDL